VHGLILGTLRGVLEELAAGSAPRTCRDIELAFMRVVQLSDFFKLGRGSDTSLAYPARPADPRPELAAPASVIHARYPSSHGSALHLQLEAWDDGSYRLVWLATEGPGGGNAASVMARRLAERFERLVRSPA
jgi:hypothetical protein